MIKRRRQKPKAELVQTSVGRDEAMFSIDGGFLD